MRGDREQDVRKTVEAIELDAARIRRRELRHRSGHLRLDRVDLRDDVEARSPTSSRSIIVMMPTRTPYLSGRAPSSRCSVSVTNMTAAIAYDSHVRRSSTSPNTWPGEHAPLGCVPGLQHAEHRRRHQRAGRRPGRPPTAPAPRRRGSATRPSLHFTDKLLAFTAIPPCWRDGTSDRDSCRGPIGRAPASVRAAERSQSAVVEADADAWQRGAIGGAAVRARPQRAGALDDARPARSPRSRRPPRRSRSSR